MSSDFKKTFRAIFMFFIGVGFVVYVAYYDQLKGLWEMIRNIIPAILFIAGSIVSYDYYHDIIRDRRIKGEQEEFICVTYVDALKNDLLAFFTAAAILLIPIIFDEKVGISDIIQAIIAFAAIYYIRIYYFNKIR